MQTCFCSCSVCSGWYYSTWCFGGFLMFQFFFLVLNRLKRISSQVNSRNPHWLLQDILTLSGECKEWRQKLEPPWSGGGFSPVWLIYTSLYKSVNSWQSSDFFFWRLNIWYFWGYWMTNISKFLTFAYPDMFFSPNRNLLSYYIEIFYWNLVKDTYLWVGKQGIKFCSKRRGWKRHSTFSVVHDHIQKVFFNPKVPKISQCYMHLCITEGHFLRDTIE